MGTCHLPGFQDGMTLEQSDSITVLSDFVNLKWYRFSGKTFGDISTEVTCAYALLMLVEHLKWRKSPARGCRDESQAQKPVLSS